jgi:hypothetical protein
MTARLVIACVAATALAPAPAEACGFFRMEDHEKHLTIGNLVNSAAIASLDNDGKEGRRVAVLYFDTDSPGGLRVAADHKVVFDVRNDKVLKYGKVVGRIAANGDVTFGKHTYAIELSDERYEHDHMKTWRVVVKRGDVVVLDSADASALCASFGRHTDPEDEVRRRVIYYLAWRET